MKKIRKYYHTKFKFAISETTLRRIRTFLITNKFIGLKKPVGVMFDTVGTSEMVNSGILQKTGMFRT